MPHDGPPAWALSWVVAWWGVAGCAVEPASVSFTGPLPGVLVSATPVVLPSFDVRDAQGAVVSPPPEGIAMSVDPASVAMVEAGRLIALDNGDAELLVRGGSRVLARHPLRVRLVDRVELECPRPHCSIAVGEQLTLHPRLFSRGATVAVPDELRWRVQPSGVLEVVRPGRFSAARSGAATVEVEVGDARALREVSVTGPLDRLRIECPPAYLARTVAGAPPVCTLRQGVQARLELSGSGGGQPIRELVAEWGSSVETVVTVESGLLYANEAGRAEITAAVGAVKATLPVEVVEACRGDWQRYALMHREESVFCRGPRAATCAARRYAEREPNEAELDTCCCSPHSPFPAGRLPRPSGSITPRR